MAKFMIGDMVVRKKEYIVPASVFKCERGEPSKVTEVDGEWITIGQEGEWLADRFERMQSEEFYKDEIAIAKAVATICDAGYRVILERISK